MSEPAAIASRKRCRLSVMAACDPDVGLEIDLSKPMYELAPVNAADRPTLEWPN